MKSPKYIAVARVLDSRLWMAPLVVAMTLVLVPPGHAEPFQFSQSLTTESNATTTIKRGSEPLRVQGHLEANGAGKFVAGNRKEEIAAVTLAGDFRGTPDRLKGLYLQVLTFSDNSTIRLVLEGDNQGKKFRANVLGSDGTGRFKGIRVTGQLAGTALDPSLNYSEIRGDYEVKP